MLVAKSCLNLCDPMSIAARLLFCRILQARILEWVAIPFSRGSFQPRDWTWVSCIAGRCFTDWATRSSNKSKTTNNSIIVTFLQFDNIKKTKSFQEQERYINFKAASISLIACFRKDMMEGKTWWNNIFPKITSYLKFYTVQKQAS